METRAAVATAPQTPLTIRELDLGPPAPGELQIRMVASGVCHTDAIVRDQWYPTPLPAVLGHEGAGVVEQLGDGVTGFEVGDKVLLSFDWCGGCRNCLTGGPGYCVEFFGRNFGGRRADGTSAFAADGEAVASHFFGQSSFSEAANVPRQCAVKVPDDTDLTALAPLGCGIQTGAGAVMNVLKPQPGSAVAVFGAGAVGLSAVMAARLHHPGRIIVVDRVESRLELARELGATDVIDAEVEDPAERIHEITDGGADYALETTGVPAVFTSSVRSAALRGTVGVVGAAALGTDASFDIGTAMPMGLAIRMIVEGDSVPARFIPQLIDLHRRGLFPFDRLITTYPFEDINSAFEDSAAGVTLKPVVTFSQR